jgi:protein tyrosine phosphatase
MNIQIDIINKNYIFHVNDKDGAYNTLAKTKALFSDPTRRAAFRTADNSYYIGKLENNIPALLQVDMQGILGRSAQLISTATMHATLEHVHQLPATAEPEISQAFKRARFQPDPQFIYKVDSEKQAFGVRDQLERLQKENDLFSGPHANKSVAILDTQGNRYYLLRKVNNEIQLQPCPAVDILDLTAQNSALESSVVTAYLAKLPPPYEAEPAPFENLFQPVPMAAALPERACLESLQKMRQDRHGFDSIPLEYKPKRKDLNAPNSEPLGKQYPAKNRYNDIVPYDHNRVTNGDGSFYINASDIDIEGQRYIAAQGPTEATVGDFWQAVLMKDSKLIISLESDPNKCYPYWTQALPFGIGPIRITPPKLFLQYKLPNKDQYIEERTFIISEPNQQDRIITHLHYVGWPDNNAQRVGGTPDKEVFELLLEHTAALGPKEGSPITVHCSGGVGRTGTFIAARAIAQQLQGLPQQSFILDTITQLRHERRAMVYTFDQYQFLCDLAMDRLQKLQPPLPVAPVQKAPVASDLLTALKNLEQQCFLRPLTQEEFEIYLKTRALLTHIVPDLHELLPEGIMEIICTCNHGWSLPRKQAEELIGTAKNKAVIRYSPNPLQDHGTALVISKYNAAGTGIEHLATARNDPVALQGFINFLMHEGIEFIKPEKK